MAVAAVIADTWVQHLPFVGGQRPSQFGPVDGIWYGMGAVLGDNTGGNVSISLQLSEARKEDWVYIIGGVAGSINSAITSDVFTQVNSGPFIPSATAVTNPSFSVGGSWAGIVNNGISTTLRSDGGIPGFTGMPVFGDKRIAGVFLMMALGAEANVDGATYQLSSWGFLIRYASFFRNVRPSVG